MPVFSADSRHLTYVAQSFAKSYFVVVDGAAGKEREAAGAGEPVFSPESSRTAWTLRREEGGFLRKRSICSILIDDEVIAEQSGDDMSRWPRFSNDGAQVAWWIRRGKEVFVFLGGESGPALSSGSEPIITSSGHLMYAGVASGQSTVFVDHRPGPGAQDWLVPIGGLPASSAADVNDSPIQFRVSPDGAHVAWGGVFPDGTRPVIDDRVGPTYDQVLSWSFAADGVATWWTQRGDVLYRVRAQGR